MSRSRVWRRLFGVERTVIEAVEIEEGHRLGTVLVARVRPFVGRQGRCGICQRRCGRYDRAEGRRRWRHLDACGRAVFLEADAPRVQCRDHGVVVAHMPWARHNSGFTYAFEDIVAWSAVQTSKTAVAALWRIDWDSVGRICDRVAADALAAHDPLDGLVRIGIDEISYRKGHRYLVVVVDHDTGRLVWAKPGRSKAVVAAFFETLGPERAAAIEIVTADGASWIADAVAEAAPDAEMCMDPFHVVGWATDALDAVRREDWNNLRHTRSDRRGAKILKGLRWLLWRNWEDLTPEQRERLDVLAATHSRLHRAWQLKEVLRQVFQLPYLEAKMQLDDWLAWASRSRIPAFVELARRIRRHRPAIERTLEWRVSNGLVESTNTKIRLIHRRAFGFRRPESLISLAMLALGGYCPPLPWQWPTDPREEPDLAASRSRRETWA